MYRTLQYSRFTFHVTILYFYVVLLVNGSCMNVLLSLIDNSVLFFIIVLDGYTILVCIFEFVYLPI